MGPSRSAVRVAGTGSRDHHAKLLGRMRDFTGPWDINSSAPFDKKTIRIMDTCRLIPFKW